MIDFSVGAVGAAIIAGLVSLLGLVIGKEQKVSEFRQAWIDALRGCLIIYLACINAISDALQLKRSGKPIDDAALITSFRTLNEANHGIRLRVNASEKPAAALLAAMDEFEALAKDDANLTATNIRIVENRFLSASAILLKFEWKRVVRGEKTYVWTKWIVIALILLMVGLFGFLLSKPKPMERQDRQPQSERHLIEFM